MRLIVFAWIIILTACAAKPLSGHKPPTVILISLDTLSAEHMDLYGHNRPTMPFLKRFGEQNVVFEHNYSSGAYTLPSHFSMFTGVSPQTHGMVIDDFNRNLTTRKLSAQFRTMAEYFKGAGYKTFWSGNLADPHLDFEAGMARGFDVTARSLLDGMTYHIPDGAQIEIRQLLRAASQQPSFLFFHSYLAHDVYKPSPPFHEMFAPGKRKPFESSRDYSLESMKLVIEARTIVKYLHDKWLGQFKLPDQREAKRISDLYDAGLRSLDEKLEIVFRILKEENLYDNSIIIVTSDHGEVFGSHGQFFHNSPYLDLLRVPLIVKMPGVQPRRVIEPSYGVDLLPTVLELVGLKPQPNVEGESLAPLIFGKSMARKTQRWFAVGYNNQTILDPNWQLMRWNNQKVELFDRVKDPRGMDDVSREYPAEVSRLDAELTAHESSRPAPDKRLPLSRPAKLYWFSIEGLRADQVKYPVFKWAREGKLPYLRYMLDFGLSGYSRSGALAVDQKLVKAMSPSSLIFERDLSAEKPEALPARFENERLELSVALDEKSPVVTHVRVKMPPLPPSGDLPKYYFGIDRLLAEAFRRLNDNTYVVLSAGGPQQGPFAVWGPRVRQNKLLSKPVSTEDQLNYILRLIDAKPEPQISDSELASATEFVL